MFWNIKIVETKKSSIYKTRYFFQKKKYTLTDSISICAVLRFNPRPRTKSNVWRINNENSPLEWPPSWGEDSAAGNNGERGLLRPVYGNRAQVLFDRRSRPPPVNYCRNFRNSIRFFFFFFWHRPAGTRPVRDKMRMSRACQPLGGGGGVIIVSLPNGTSGFIARQTITVVFHRRDDLHERVGGVEPGVHGNGWGRNTPLGHWEHPQNVVIFLICVKRTCEIFEMYRRRCYHVVTELLRTRDWDF